MAISFYTIFGQKTGVSSYSTPWDNADIDVYLDQATFGLTCTYATPLTDFDSITVKYQYAVTLLAAIEFWWEYLAKSIDKFDQNIGPQGVGQRSATKFERALIMIERLKDEIDSLDIVKEGSGDIIVGDLVKRSKFTGYVVPRSDDVAGDWLSD